jgi:transcription termination/antitermination protein NusG
VTEQTGEDSEVLRGPAARVVGGTEPEQSLSATQPGDAPAAPRDSAPTEAEPVASGAENGRPAEAAPPQTESEREQAGEPLAGSEAPAEAPSMAEEAAAAEVAKPTESAPAKAKTARAKKSSAPPVPVDTGPKSENMNWYILKVQSNREESIREGLLRRVAIHGLDRFFDEVIVPTETVTELKGGKKRVIKRKLYPGYLVVHMEINEDTWFLVRETPGIGDFTGASGVPTPMLPHEVERIVAKQEEKRETAPDLKIPFMKGDRVKVIEGNFENFEGEVDNIDKTNGRVTVMITIFNRTTPVEFEYWQVESL